MIISPALVPGIDDALEVGALEGSATDEAAIHVGLREDFLGVAGLAAATIEDADVLCSGFAEAACDDTTDEGVHVFSLLSGSGPAGADGHTGS